MNTDIDKMNEEIQQQINELKNKQKEILLQKRKELHSELRRISAEIENINNILGVSSKVGSLNKDKVKLSDELILSKIPKEGTDIKTLSEVTGGSEINVYTYLRGLKRKGLVVTQGQGKKLIYFIATTFKAPSKKK